MNLIAIGLRILGAYRVWRDMQAGKPVSECAGPVAKTPHGVYDIEIRAVKREAA